MKRNKYEFGGITNMPPVATSSIGTNFSTPNSANIASYAKMQAPDRISSAPTTGGGGGGGGFDLSGMGSGVNGIISHLGEVSSELSGKKFKEQAGNYEQGINSGVSNGINQISGLMTNDSLMSGYSSYNPLSGPVIKKKSAGETIGQHLMAGAKGANAGMSVGGPWGALIGAVAASVADIVGQIGGNAQRKKAQKRLDRATNRYNNIMDNSFDTQISKVDALNDRQAMANFAELGGFIPTMSGAIGYDLANKQLAVDNLFAMNQGKLPNNKFVDGGNLFANIPNINNHGGLFSTGLELINAGGKHASNPLGGVPMGVDEQGIPNLVEEGEVKWNDYIFSNKLKLDKVGARQNTIDNKYVGKTYAEIAKIYNDEPSERPNDPVSKLTLNDNLSRLMSAQEADRSIEEISNANKYAGGGNLDLLRQAPIIGSGLMTAADAFGLTNRSDYTNVDLINNPPQLTPITPRRITNYMSYVPLDRDYYINRQNAQTAATREAVMNASNGNRGALMNTLAAVDYGGNIAEGALARQAQEADLQQQMQIANFNRGTDMFNTQLGMQADAELLQAQRYNNQTRAQVEMQKAQMRDIIDSRAAAGRSANLNSFLSNLNALGNERFAMNMITENPGLYYTINKDGSITYKNGYNNLPANQKAIVDADIANTKGNKKACGGKLHIKS